jgi:putative ABC transport system ATP-binding protein
MLVGRHLALSYGANVALADASATIADGEIVTLVGPSGSGKSTMLYCLAGLLRADSGQVSFDGRDMTAMSDDARSNLRRRSFGCVFQFAELVPELTLRENIALPLDLNGVGRRERRRRVHDLIATLGLDDYVDRRPAKVSGGQAQRAAVARAIAHRPRVLFADEPTGSLDTANGKLVLDAILGLARDDGTAVVIVTHDNEVAALGDRVIEMRDGFTGVAA